jgi:hypothetical protein
MYQLTVNKSVELSLYCLELHIIDIDDVPKLHRDACVRTLIKQKSKLITYQSIYSLFKHIINPTKDVYWKYVYLVYDDMFRNYPSFNDISHFKTEYGPIVNRLWDSFDEPELNINEVSKCFRAYKKSMTIYLNSKEERFMFIIIDHLVRKWSDVLRIVLVEYYIPHDIRLELVKKDWRVIQYITKPSDLECYYAISQSCEVIQHVKNPSDEMIQFAISQDQRIV